MRRPLIRPAGRAAKSQPARTAVPRPADLKRVALSTFDARIARAEALGHRLEVSVAEPGIQRRYDFERFRDYRSAKKANPYAKALLDTQSDAIENHVGKTFDGQQRDEIYKVNQNANGGKIISDGDHPTELTLQDSAVTPHIDHRFPKSKGGSNHYTNAQILPAAVNIRKGAKLELDKEPTVPLNAYANLRDNSAFADGKVGSLREFSSEQRAAIKDANRAHYGQLKSDGADATVLSPLDSSQVPNIDHIVPKSGGGSNFYFNAAVLPMDENITKGGVRGGGKGNDELDWEIGQMSLEEYYANKRKLQSSKRTPKPLPREKRLEKNVKETQERQKKSRKKAIAERRNID